MSSSENISLAVQQNQQQTQTTQIPLQIQQQLVQQHVPTITQQQSQQHQQQLQQHQQLQLEVEDQQVLQQTLQTLQTSLLQSPLQPTNISLQQQHSQQLQASQQQMPQQQQHQQQQPQLTPQQQIHHQQVHVQVQVQQPNQQQQQEQLQQHVHQVRQQQQQQQQQIQLQQQLQLQQRIQQQMEQDEQRKDGTCSTRSLSDYLAQLLKDRKQLDAFPNIFLHVERLLEEEITNVRASLFSLPKKPRVLPPPEGPIIVLNDKVYVPVKEYPDFNFVGRLLGPRGLTAKQLEADTGCKIMVRGKGSMRNKEEEDNYRGKPNYEHLSDDLHILISVEDTENRAKLKLEHAVSEIKKILVPSAQGEDELKKRQLMELAIINGTYRDTSSKSPYVTTSKSDWRRRIDTTTPNNQVFTHTLPCIATKIRGYAPATLGTPLILSPSASVTPFENPSTHMILVPCGDCGNYATFTSNALLTDNSEKTPVNGLKDQRRVLNANHINRSLAGVASKNGFRAN